MPIIIREASKFSRKIVSYNYDKWVITSQAEITYSKVMTHINVIVQYILDIMEYISYIHSMENIKLKIARVEKGLSQQELADLVDVTRQTIGLIEKGKYNPTLNLCIKIAKAFNKTLNDLFWEEK